jgi:hypothetical protein
MDRLFQNYKHFVKAYINDITIFSKTAEEYLEHLAIVLDTLDRARVYILVPKSFAGYLVVRLLGYIVNGEGIIKTDDRIAAFKKLKFPANLSDLERYLSMVGWLC